MRSVLAILKVVLSKIKALNDNKLGADLLWENSSPTASFGAQSVSAQCSGHKFIGIDFRGGSMVWIPYSDGKLGAYKQNGSVQANASYAWVGAREFILYPTNVTFYDHYHKYVNSTTGNTKSNGNAIPLAIYGLK